MKMMTDEEKQVHLNNVIKLLSGTQRQVQGMDFNQFSREEQVYQEVYGNLQNAGQAAHMLQQEFDDRLRAIGLEALANFRNARFNSEAEMDHSVVWGFLRSEDVENMLDELEKASADVGSSHEHLEDDKNRL